MSSQNKDKDLNSIDFNNSSSSSSSSDNSVDISEKE
jgi:hypothetical protein